MSLGDTLLQLLFRFIVSTLYGAYLPRSYVGSDGLLRQHFPKNVFSAFIIIIIIIIIIIHIFGKKEYRWFINFYSSLFSFVFEKKWTFKTLNVTSFKCL